MPSVSSKQHHEQTTCCFQGDWHCSIKSGTPLRKLLLATVMNYAENEAYYFRVIAHFLVKRVFNLIGPFTHQICLQIPFVFFQKKSPLLSSDENLRPIMNDIQKEPTTDSKGHTQRWNCKLLPAKSRSTGRKGRGSLGIHFEWCQTQTEWVSSSPGS
jgi:hypothetical protein